MKNITNDSSHVSKSGEKKDLAYFQIKFENVEAKNRFEKTFKAKFIGGEIDFGIKYYTIKISWDKKEAFLDFFDEFKKEKENKKTSLKSRSAEHYICFFLNIPVTANTRFQIEFGKKFPSDELSIKGVAKISPKREKDFDQFLLDFNNIKSMR